MKGAFLIAAREIAERRAVILAALCAGIIPFAAPLFPGVRAGQASEARDGLALVFCVAFGTGMALLLGGTIVGRDLSEGRMGFDFARPLRGGSIWAGRLLGAVALTLLVLLVVALPTTLVGGGLLSRGVPHIRLWAPAAVAAVLVLVPLAHVTSIAFRARSPWLLVDLAGLVLTLVIGALAGRRLADGFAFMDLVGALAVLALLAFATLWLATFAQVAAGRTDLRRGHGIQATVLWGSLLAAVTCFDLYSRFVVGAGPEDILSAQPMPAPRGDWLVVTGNARGRGDFAPTFLMNGRTGRALALGGADPSVESPVVFSGDGEHAVWLRPGGFRDPRHDVLKIDLARAEEGFHETRLSFPNPFLQVALSEDGERLAALEGASLAVYRTADGALLASGRCGEGERDSFPRPTLFFVDADRVRVVLARTRIEIHELDVAARTITKTGEAAPGTCIARDRAGRKLLLRDGHGASEESRLLDGRSGAVLASFPPDASVKRNGFRFLEDGRLLFVERREGSSVIRSIDAAGHEKEHSVAAIARVLPGGEIAPGVVTLSGDEGVFLLDLGTGTVRELASGNLTACLANQWLHRGIPAATGSLATRLFHSGGAVVVLEPDTGRGRVLVGRKEAS